ncbi:Sec-independent protein translocase protein TatB [Beggiatoa leptomitoformis]|uniref:Sec-independent protein translocase protein TatB n=1 Tax=Beggiatoa leptomitoformis TaxID=288004 RepID=A0A2N9YIL4_9GAMM|nr:Sec-independent protein translocase protein TatB [Beggiatoa leptomitoformis]ALG67419.1 twin-arginine translocase subunit TatB [Beggiatoa leptomitoformis]AUI70368.1 twin-arginine translocase subunit TatB [Beggiatoa leptomitoformis]
MFEIGFGELVLIGVIALIVIGPDKLPGAARTAGLWIGKMRRFVSSIKDEVDKELKLQELQQTLKEVEKNSIQQFVEETRKTTSDLQNALNASAMPAPATPIKTDTVAAVSDTLSPTADKPAEQRTNTP